MSMAYEYTNRLFQCCQECGFAVFLSLSVSGFLLLFCKRHSLPVRAGNFITSITTSTTITELLVKSPPTSSSPQHHRFFYVKPQSSRDSSESNRVDKLLCKSLNLKRNVKRGRISGENRVALSGGSTPPAVKRRYSGGDAEGHMSFLAAKRPKLRLTLTFHFHIASASSSAPLRHFMEDSESITAARTRNRDATTAVKLSVASEDSFGSGFVCGSEPGASRRIGPLNHDSPSPQQAPSIHGDDLIVTPFAQILASLRNVRANLISITNIQTTDEHANRSVKRPPLHSTTLPDNVVVCANETLEELDWCLDQLETIQTHRSVSEMASSKFRKMLNKELSHFAESSKSGSAVSKFLLSTYLDKDDDEPSIEIEVPGEGPSTSSPQMAVSLLKKAQTAAMNRISGVRKLRAPSHEGHLPEYGTVCQKEIAVYMQRLDDWGPDIFKIDELSKNHSLTVVTYTLLRKRGLIKAFEIPSSVLVTYLLNLEHHYRNNPYHNSIHGADVAQSMHVLLSSPVLADVFSDLEILAAIFSGAIHDVDHPGFTNQYLINSNNELAIMYNDESVLEQHHLAVAFKLLQDSNCDFLVGLSKKQRLTFRKICIDLVLSTDMARHMSLLADLKTMVEAKKVAGNNVIVLDKYNEKIQVLQSMIHLADLSNPTKPIQLYQQWTDRIFQEYLRQGNN
ncbi:hypothetical protein WR25_15247 [Diploscapter pachys]|uniref:Phosphodiesterase n=1 Tax=Diploscapter pachys TaxID=2018661 RepID=A0A2A2LUN0_9BILA|nr:hypothetical protein WR25_15247 [Diploscapter pachys]